MDVYSNLKVYALILTVEFSIASQDFMDYIILYLIRWWVLFIKFSKNKHDAYIMMKAWTLRKKIPIVFIWATMENINTWIHKTSMANEGKNGGNLMIIFISLMTSFNYIVLPVCVLNIFTESFIVGRMCFFSSWARFF